MNGKPPAKPLSIYVHLPYCTVKCPFCNLNAWEQKQFDENAYTGAIEKECRTLAERKPEFVENRVVETVFFGGGTPSLFSAGAMERLTDFLARMFRVSENAEITVEAHPLSCETARLTGYRRAGINRISVGAQSFSSDKLKRLGRMHGADKCFEAIENSVKAGFENISIDIIAGAPAETAGMFEKDIKTAGATGVGHMSVYGLEFEKGTRFYALAKKGKIAPVSEEQSARMLETAAEQLEAFELERYEISSFAAENKRCRHNINYWRSGDFIGLGAGAHSHLTTRRRPFGIRWANPRNPSEYIEKAGGKTAEKTEILNSATGFSDFVMMGLRLADGTDICSAEKKFRMRADWSAIESLEKGGFVKTRDGNVKLTGKGFLVANSVIVNITQKAKTDF